MIKLVNLKIPNSNILYNVNNNTTTTTNKYYNKN